MGVVAPRAPLVKIFRNHHCLDTCRKMSSQREASWPGGRGAIAPNFFEIVGFSKVYFVGKFSLLLLVKIKVMNFIGDL